MAITSAIINTIGSGPAIQETTSSRVAPIMRTIAQRNHSVSGTSASEVRRCAHQCVAPALRGAKPARAAERRAHDVDVRGFRAMARLTTPPGR